MTDSGQPRMYASVTRISDLAAGGYGVEVLERESWATGDILTSGGLMGRTTSRSDLVTAPTPARYVGHVIVGGRKATMRDYVPEPPSADFSTPVVLVIGTSMSAGKTTTARVVTRELRDMGKVVVGAKFTGAGRHSDVLSMRDAGAEHVRDFLDVGLPSTCVPPVEFRSVMKELLVNIAELGADVVVAEAGASPLEPYNGGEAVVLLGSNVRLTALAASDPYAVLGIMYAFGSRPDFVTGPATNTEAGRQLVEKLTGVSAINVRRPEALPAIRRLLEERFAA